MWIVISIPFLPLPFRAGADWLLLACRVDCGNCLAAIPTSGMSGGVRAARMIDIRAGRVGAVASDRDGCHCIPFLGIRTDCFVRNRMRASPNRNAAICADGAEREIGITGDSPGDCPVESSGVFPCPNFLNHGNCFCHCCDSGDVVSSHCFFLSNWAF